jgi:hypothetical protein
VNRPPTWLVATLGVVAAEALLYLGYPAHLARFHWFAHFFVGASVALSVLTVWTLEQRRRPPLPILWVAVGHLVAMFPDVLFALGIAHHRWMDGFLGHLTSVRVPGGLTTWYCVFLLLLAVYLAADVRVQAATIGRRRRRRQPQRRGR